MDKSVTGPAQEPKGSDRPNRKDFKDRKFRRRPSTHGDESRLDNDVRWYAANEQILKDAASLAYSNPQGINATYEKTSIPGKALVLMELAHTIGSNVANEASPVTAWIRATYSFVRHANSGHTNYEAPDLGVMLLAMGECVAFYAWMTRIYGLMRYFNGKNRIFPKKVFDAISVDYDDILVHVADLRYYINTFALRFNSLNIPSTFPYFQRRAWLYAGLFKDEDVDKATCYIFNPKYLLYYDATTEETGSSLQPQYLHFPNDPNPLKFNDIMAIGEGLLNALLGDEDINIMSGDILKAYGAENCFKLNQIAEDYFVAPVYSKEVLGQIHNATILHNPDFSASELKTAFKVTQTAGTGELRQTPTWSEPTVLQSLYRTSITCALPAQVFDDIGGEPSPAANMVNSRLMCAGTGRLTVHEDPHTAEETITITIFGTEIVTGARIWLADYSNDWYFEQLSSFLLDSTYIVEMACAISTADYHPFLYSISEAGSGASRTQLGDLNNYTLLTQFELNKMHTVALLSMFNVPQAAVRLR